MLPSSPNSPGASLHQTHGFLPPSVHFDPPSAMLKTSRNMLTPMLNGPSSSLSATSTTRSSCLPKKYYSSLVSSSSDNSKRLWQIVNKLLHRKSSSPLPTTFPGTSLADSFASFFHRQNIQTPSFFHQQPHYIISALTVSSCHPWLLSFHSCLRIWSPCTRSCPQDPVTWLLLYQMWNWSVFLVHILLWCPWKLCPWSTTLRHVLYTTPLSTVISSSSAKPSHRSLPFLLQDWLHGFPRLYTVTSEHVRLYFLVFLFYTF